MKIMYKNIPDKKSILIKFFIIISAALAVIYSKEVSRGIYEGIFFCAEILVPSIFPFMVISALAVRSGFSCKAVDKVFAAFFGLSGKSALAVLIGAFGGYPVGASSIAALYKNKEISKNEAVRAAYIAVSAGPGFLISFVGVRLLNSFKAGIILFVSQILSLIILALLNKIIFGKIDYNSKTEYYPAAKNENLLVKSVSSAVHSAIEMCAIVCIFSAGINLIEKHISKNFIVSIILEVTRACFKLSGNSNLVYIAFAVGFGGLCVHFQVFQALDELKINKVIFFVFRIIQGILTALFTYIFIKIFNISIPVFSSVKNITLDLSASALGSFLLIFTGICFLYSIKNNLEE